MDEYRFKVKEMADMFDISVKTLHLYDKMHLFQPDYVDEHNGYRYYSTSQVDKLNTIISLKNVGFSLHEISKMFEDMVSYEELSRLLQLKRADSQKHMDLLLLNIDALDNMILAAEKGTMVKDRLTDQEHAIVLAKISCLENIKFENFITSILWL